MDSESNWLRDHEIALAEAIRARTGWRQGLEFWVRAGFRCEYCGRSLMDSTLAYGLSQADHILPRSRYPRLGGNPLNLAQVCGACNKIKRNWDPGEGNIGEAQLQSARDEGIMSEQMRAELVALCKRRNRWELLKMESEIAAVRQVLHEHFGARVG